MPLIYPLFRISPLTYSRNPAHPFHPSCNPFHPSCNTPALSSQPYNFAVIPSASSLIVVFHHLYNRFSAPSFTGYLPIILSVLPLSPFAPIIPFGPILLIYPPSPFFFFSTLHHSTRFPSLPFPSQHHLSPLWLHTSMILHFPPDPQPTPSYIFFFTVYIIIPQTLQFLSPTTSFYIALQCYHHDPRQTSSLSPPRLAPDIVVDDGEEPSPVHGGGMDQQGKGSSSDKLPIVLLQGFFRGPGAASPHHRRPSVVSSWFVSSRPMG